MAQQRGFDAFQNRYKFTGKELDEETGLYYFAARYYDPKASIWLSVDPLAEKYPAVNPYVYCLDNPIRYIDPDGNAPYDHIFDKYGNFIKDTHSGSAVKIQIGNRLYSPSELDSSRGSRKTMTKIGAYYAGKLGAKNTVVTTRNGSADNENSSENPASTRKNVISLNFKGGWSSLAFDNYNNFKSVIGHEHFHKKNNDKTNFKSDLRNHAGVYIDQMGLPSFNKTTDEFKYSMAVSFGNYLLNMDKSNDFDRFDVLKKIDDFNSINTGGLQMSKPSMNYTKGTLYLEIYYKNYEPLPVEYKKINE